ncbi:conserved hypothetical protein, partial [Ricinus communis]
MTSSRRSRHTPPNVSLNLGSIDNAGSFGQQFPEAAELQPSAPVFVAPIDDGLAERVTGRAILRMGIIPLPTGGAILSIRYSGARPSLYGWRTRRTGKSGK